MGKFDFAMRYTTSPYSLKTEKKRHNLSKTGFVVLK